MRPQKSKKNRDSKSYRKWKGYYLSDVDCMYCKHYRGKKRGCPFHQCEYTEERLNAVANGKFVRPKVKM